MRHVSPRQGYSLSLSLDQDGGCARSRARRPPATERALSLSLGVRARRDGESWETTRLGLAGTRHAPPAKSSLRARCSGAFARARGPLSLSLSLSTTLLGDAGLATARARSRTVRRAGSPSCRRSGRGPTPCDGIVSLPALSLSLLKRERERERDPSFSLSLFLSQRGSCSGVRLWVRAAPSDRSSLCFPTHSYIISFPVRFERSSVSSRAARPRAYV